MNRDKVFVYLKETTAWILSLIIIIPFAVVLLNTFKTSSEASQFALRLPREFQWSNYPVVIRESNLIRAFFNSLILSLFPTILSILFCAMAAFPLSRNNKSTINKLLRAYFLFGLMAPLNYVPAVLVLKWLHLSNTFTGTSLLIGATGVPFAFFLFYGFIGSINREIDEAAIIDGCGSFSLFFKIIFPLLKPVTVTGFVLNFIGAWNDFRTPLYILNTSTKWGMVINMFSYFGQRLNDWNLVCTVIILTLAPVMLMYVIGQRYIISGMTAGAIKG